MLPQGGGTHWIRTQYPNDERQTKYAFHTKQGNKTFYLLPYPDKEEDGHRSKTIRAVEIKDTSSTHVFTLLKRDCALSNTHCQVDEIVCG